MSTAQVHNLFRWRAPIRDPPPSPPPPSYEDATRPATIADQWNTFVRTFSLAESLFSPQNRRTRFEFAYLLSTALPPVFPEEDARVLASLLSKFVASTEELNTHPDLIRRYGERIIAMRTHYMESGRLDLAEALTAMSETGASYSNISRGESNTLPFHEMRSNL
jgi:hypothetical protein